MCRVSRVSVVVLLLVGTLVGCGEEQPPLAPVQQAVAKADAVLILGDSTGNDEGEWVELWASEIAEVRTVTYHHWNADLEKFPPAVEMGGDGPPLDVWNLSAGGQRAEYPRAFLDEVEQEPDVVLYSFGHNHTAEDIGAALAGTMDQVAERWGDVPSAWMLQNPSTTFRRDQQADTISELRELAAAEGVPLIDAHAAFPATPDGLDPLLRDGTHPNEQGSRLWAETVREAIGFPR